MKTHFYGQNKLKDMIRIVNYKKETLLALGVQTYPFKQGEIISFDSIKYEIMSINHEIVFEDDDFPDTNFLPFFPIITIVTVNKIS